MKWTKFNEKEYSELSELRAYLVYDAINDQVEITAGYEYYNENNEETGWCWQLKDMERVTHYTKLELPKQKGKR